MRDVLPERAQGLYLKAYNQAWDEYREGQGYLSRDGVAHQRGWTAVQHEYVQDQRTGRWHRIGEAPAEYEESRGFLGKLKSLFSGRG
jgi:cation transport regulator